LRCSARACGARPAARRSRRGWCWRRGPAGWWWWWWRRCRRLMRLAGRGGRHHSRRRCGRHRRSSRPWRRRALRAGAALQWTGMRRTQVGQPAQAQPAPAPAAGLPAWGTWQAAAPACCCAGRSAGCGWTRGRAGGSSSSSRGGRRGRSAQTAPSRTQGVASCRCGWLWHEAARCERAGTRARTGQHLTTPPCLAS